jgi:hypothetical protein
MPPSGEQAGKRGRALLLRGAGWLWILAWGAVLWSVALPWQYLGGLVDERLRWLERFVLGAGLVVGWQAGVLGRRAARPGSGFFHLRLLRRLLWPQASLTAVGLLFLYVTRNSDPIGIVTTAFLSYWAGLDLAFAAWPLVRGEPYSLTGSIDTAVESDAETEDEAADPPRWMGL